MSQTKADQVTRRDEKVAQRQEYNRPLGIFEARDINTEGQQDERARHGAQQTEKRQPEIDHCLRLFIGEVRRIARRNTFLS